MDYSGNISNTTSTHPRRWSQTRTRIVEYRIGRIDKTIDIGSEEHEFRVSLTLFFAWTPRLLHSVEIKGDRLTSGRKSTQRRRGCVDQAGIMNKYLSRARRRTASIPSRLRLLPLGERKRCSRQ